MGAWPPVSRGAMIEPLADLAACTPHSSRSAEPAGDASPEADDAPRAVTPTNGR
jgi:hypothetical protein